MKRELYEVQVKHADVLMASLEKHGSALDGSATGTGKTLIGAEIAQQSERPTLVICPKSSVPMWQQELCDRGCNVIGAINYEMVRTGRTPYGEWAGERLWQWKLPEDAFVIWDEVQKCQGMNTQNARMCWSSRAYYNLCLSATAAEDPTEMKALGYLLRLHNLKDFWNWSKMHGCAEGLFGGLQFSGTDEDIDLLHRIIYPKHGARLTRYDMREHFQETKIITTPLDFGPQMKTIYSAMESELAGLTKRKSEGFSEADVLVIRLRARQKAELMKVPFILELAEDLFKEKQAIAIFVNFSATLYALYARLAVNHGVSVIDGKHVKDRQKQLDDFQSDRNHIILCNTQAGGVSVNMHDLNGRYPRHSIVSPSDNAKDILQLLGRIDRAGALTPTIQHVLFAAGTIEEEVEANCANKIRRIGIFNEGLDEEPPKDNNESTVNE